MEIKYLDTIYSEEVRPLTSYPGRLATFLMRKYSMKEGDTLLDVCSGRAEVSNVFSLKGMECSCIDREEKAGQYAKTKEFKRCDLEKDAIPFADDSFDYIYSKSAIEHFYYPEKLFAEMIRVVKPGGMIINLTPAWEYNMRNFYEDFTHRTPFSKDSLHDMQTMIGLEEVKVEYFKQLPLLWGETACLQRLASGLTRVLVPDYFQQATKWIKFSKEIMLLSSAIKPK